MGKEPLHRKYIGPTDKDLQKSLESIKGDKMSDQEEFKGWIKQHASRFRSEGYSTAEIVKLAGACGFNKKVVADWAVKRESTFEVK